MFVQGKLYRRRDLHNQHGGQSQGGISTPANQNFIFIFTGEQGERYGYSDSWTDDGIFFYTGEGQRGDMQFVRGNKAVRGHFKDGKEVFLFSYGRRRGWVRYVGQMGCSLICPFNASFVLLPQ